MPDVLPNVLPPGANWVRRPPPLGAVGSMAAVAAAGAITLCKTAEILSPRALSDRVRAHPMLFMLLMSGVGYLFGHRMVARRRNLAAGGDGRQKNRPDNARP
jgi:hypothetical protein